MGSNPGKEEYFLFSKPSRLALEPSNFLFKGCLQLIPPKQRNWSKKLTNRLSVAQRLKMPGALHPVLLRGVHRGNFICTSALRSCKCVLILWFPYQNSECIYLLPMYATCPAHPIQCCSPFCRFLHPRPKYLLPQHPLFSAAPPCIFIEAGYNPAVTK